MNHPASRWSAAALLLVAVITTSWLVMGGTTQTALANFAEPLVNAKTAKFKLTARAEGKIVAVSDFLVSGSRMRSETEMPGGARKQITIMDNDAGIEFILLPTEKRAEIHRSKNRPEHAKTGGFLAEIRKMLLESEIDDKTTRESLGERETDGRRLVGYRIANPAMALELWGDPATGLPHSIVQTMSAYPSMTTTFSEFEFDTPIDESLLSIEPPQGYTVSERESDFSLPTEDDLIAALRTAAELNDGTFPDALNMEVGQSLVKSFRKSIESNVSAEELEIKSHELRLRISRGFGFTMQFPADRHHYAGKIVKLGMPNKLIYWYQPEGKETYRVIYADLSVGDTNEKPSAE